MDDTTLWHEHLRQIWQIMKDDMVECAEATDLETLSDLRYRAGEYNSAVMYATLFLPELLLIDGYIVLADGVEQWDDLDGLTARLRDSRERALDTQERVNRVEIGYMFGRKSWGCTDLSTIKILGDAIRLAWSAWLALRFPSIKCDVWLENAGPDDDWEDLTVTFRQQ